MPRQLLHSLLEYIQEQAKDIDPKGFRLSNSKGFVRHREDFAGLPGVEFDIKVEGDHTWLRVARLEAAHPPGLPEDYCGLVNVSPDPSGAQPSISEVNLKSWITKLYENKTPEIRERVAAELRATLVAFLEKYTVQWHTWAEGEK